MINIAFTFRKYNINTMFGHYDTYSYITDIIFKVYAKRGDDVNDVSR